MLVKAEAATRRGRAAGWSGRAAGITPGDQQGSGPSARHESRELGLDEAPRQMLLNLGKAFTPQCLAHLRQRPALAGPGKLEGAFDDLFGHADRSGSDQVGDEPDDHGGPERGGDSGQLASRSRIV
jgi:hypothetical protein